MLASHIRAGRGQSPLKPRVLVCHPSDASPEERDRLVTAVLMAGAGAVRLASEPVAAVLGSGAQPTRPRMVIDFGEGVTDLAVVQGEQALASTALRIGLAEIRQLVQHAVFEEHHVSLHPEEIASLLTRRADLRDWLPVRRAPRRRERERAAGRRVLARLLFVRNAVVADALKGALDLVGQTAAGLRLALAGRERDAIASDGILLSGGGALVPHFRQGIAQRLGLDVRTAPDPLHAVIEGARRLLWRDLQAEWLTAGDLALSSAVAP
jgi:rod shape-determining protein MreB